MQAHDDPNSGEVHVSGTLVTSDNVFDYLTTLIPLDVDSNTDLSYT